MNTCSIMAVLPNEKNLSEHILVLNRVDVNKILNSPLKTTQRIKVRKIDCIYTECRPSVKSFDCFYRFLVYML